MNSDDIAKLREWANQRQEILWDMAFTDVEAITDWHNRIIEILGGGKDR